MPGGIGSSRAFAVTTENEETKMTDIIIQGIGGRMGHALCEMIANRSDCRVVAGIDQQDGELYAADGDRSGIALIPSHQDCGNGGFSAAALADQRDKAALWEP